MNVHRKVGIGILLFALIGLWFLPEYGMSYDDQHNREFGLATYDFIQAKLTGEPYVCVNEYCVISKQHGLIHGPVFELPLIVFEKILGLTDMHDIYLLRHVSVWLFFCFGLFVLYLVCYRFTNNVSYSLLGTLWLALTPRILADAFYNSVDIPFVVFNILVVYTLLLVLEKQSWQRVALHGAVSGLAFDLRVVAGIWILITLGLLAIQKRDFFSRDTFFNISGIYLGTFFFTALLCWPLLWQSPLLLIPAISEVAGFDMIIYTLFGGTMLTGPGSPWNYLPVWMGITLPLVILTFGTIGFISSITSLRRKELTLTIPLIWFTLPLLLVLLCNPTLYSGWRHFFFIYPAFIVLALYGIQSITAQIQKHPILTKLLSLILILSVVHLVVLDVTYHPYQHLYFNALAPPMTTPCEMYDTDYWGLSYKEIFEQVLAQDNRSLIKLYTLHIQAPHFLSALPPEQRVRLTLVNTSTQADYYVTNYYERKNICNKQLFGNMTVTKRVNGIPLYTIQKLR